MTTKNIPYGGNSTAKSPGPIKLGVQAAGALIARGRVTRVSAGQPEARPWGHGQEFSFIPAAMGNPGRILRRKRRDPICIFVKLPRAVRTDSMRGKVESSL